MTLTWTPEQITALAPDAASAKAGQALGSPRKWVALGRNEQAVWGLCQGSGKDPYQTQIELSEPAFKCSCPSRKFPCKHGLGLLLLLASQPQGFTQDEPPEWVKEWLQGRAKRTERAQDRTQDVKGNVPDSAAQARRAASREAKVKAGLAELELWLHDLVRGGIANMQSRPYGFWEGMAARLVDAQAPGLARLLRQMAGVPSSGVDWQEELLRRLSRLHLALEGFKHLDELPPATQADLRTLIGWAQSQEELLAQPEPGVRDHWLILGVRVEEEERLRVSRTYLWGRDTGRSALVVQFAPVGAASAFDTTLLPGTALDAALIFYPGAYPLRAVVKERFGPPQPLYVREANAQLINEQPLNGMFQGSTVANAIASYSTALALNPWLEAMPLALTGVVPVHDGRCWRVRDGAHEDANAPARELPLVPSFEGGWRMMALSGGHAISSFGEWDGRYFLPLGMYQGHRWVGF